MNHAIIGLGSNIDPERNIQKAKELLAREYHILNESRFEITKPIGNIQQADFINGAILLETELSLDELKCALKRAESDLRRMQTDICYGPRTIDLDIIIWNNQIIDEDFYSRDYLKHSALELIPSLSYE